MIRNVFIDAGIEYIRVYAFNSPLENNDGKLYKEIIIKNNDDLSKLFTRFGIFKMFSNNGNNLKNGEPAIYISGKLSEITRKILGRGETIIPSAALWAAAKKLISHGENGAPETLGIIDLSASGYMVICIDKKGDLKDDLLITNPRCGAGTGVNLSRILQKLDIRWEEVDQILSDYLGDKGREKRLNTPVRSDRCGVFSSSATISDKNQGIPLDYALAVTMKSEILKPCKKISGKTEKVYLTGGVFKWQFARDCATDFFKEDGVREIVYENNHSVLMTGMQYLVKNIGNENFRKENLISLTKPETLLEIPSFQYLKEKYKNKGLFKRLPDPKTTVVDHNTFPDLPVNIGLDIGSTMAKIVITNSITGKLLFHNSYNNHGDTIETIKFVFRKLYDENINKLKIQNIGITGSGRYQVQKTLQAIYPHLEDRISVMVENYAHAWGSIPFAKKHIQKLLNSGINEINKDFCLLIDIGGEDTKISAISLKKNELFDNAMNIKCSAGTGSLMDTLKALFNINSIENAYKKAFQSPKAYGINATCAVFLMENARKMQSGGYSKDEILASCCHAIVENMARSLWNQIEFIPNTITLLHGQTMLSDPLPLAVVHRLQEYTGKKNYCLVPPLPGHRACIGLIKNIENKNLPEIDQRCHLDALLNHQFNKKIIICKGAACGDKNSRCARTKLKSKEQSGRISLTLGGCTAVNELQVRKINKEKKKTPDAYNNIWKFIDNKMPRSNNKSRLVIPRCYAVSEKALFFAKIFQQFNIPVHVDNVCEKDIVEALPLFSIDTCAPNIGTSGQFIRLAREDHGIILLPQIDYLSIENSSLGRTCTSNQGGIQIACHYAKMKYPQARFKLFDVSMDKMDPQYLTDQLYPDFQSVFEYYNKDVPVNAFYNAVKNALDENRKLQFATAELAADFIEEAIVSKKNISIICAREYILNPGIYDSHVGKLLKDKEVIAIPAYVFDTLPDDQFNFIFWKNPHDLLSKSHAIANKQFHKIIKYPRLKKLIKKIETGITGTLLSIVTVSTFRCGPDSITLPILTEITKNIPSLLIQSDAMIAELAHLENRVNTHLNQLNKKLHNLFSNNGKDNISFKLLDEFSLNSINKEKDVIYLPTINDNRVITSLLRAGGLTVIDNFDDETYNLEKAAKIGRKFIGDSACVPLAAVFGDMIEAINDFRRRKVEKDPLVKDKERLLLFMHTGDGPCRQGNYIDICKFNIYKIINNSEKQTSSSINNEFPVKFLSNIATSRHNKKDFPPEIEPWMAAQSFHGIIMKGLLHSIFLKGASNCKNFDELEKFKKGYIKLKETIFDIFENKMKPGEFPQHLIKKFEQILPKYSGIIKYFGYGLFNNNGLRKVLKSFNNKWLKNGNNDKYSENAKKIKIHVEGEIYLRVAQIDEVFKHIVNAIGFNSFELCYSPMWSYFEYILETRILIADKEIKTYQNKLITFTGNKTEILSMIEKNKKAIKETTNTINNLRNILAYPLYKAAGLEIPHKIKNIISTAKPVLPTSKPFGELIPYVGSTILQLNNGTDLVLNVAPEGCMVASMGEMLNPKIMQCVNDKNKRIQHLFTTEGEVNKDLLQLSLLKTLGIEKYYSKQKIS